jgi:S1-C subfamily serine protease
MRYGKRISFFLKRISTKTTMKFAIILSLFISANLCLVRGESKETKKPSAPKFTYGTGAIISTKGLIVTCAHVVGTGKRISVYYNNKNHDAEILDVINDRGQDLAILRCKELEGQPHFVIRPSGAIKPGETVFALGFPQADVLGAEIKITKGEISSKTGYKNDSNIWQTSTDIHPGSSGGPFVDEWGKLVGIANSYIPEERIGYCTKNQLLLDKAEPYLSELTVIPADSIPPRSCGLARKLFHMIAHRNDTKKTMSQIRETSQQKVVVVCVE